MRAVFELHLDEVYRHSPISPTGKSLNLSISCPVRISKIFLFAIDPNQNYKRAILSHTEGRFAIVTDVGHGMRWTRGGAKDERACLADGEVVWS
jgi:hypothetical protein